MKRFIILLVVVLSLISGCSWQGQRHQQFEDGKISINNEWWSMRFIWVSSGVEAYTKSPFYESGASLQQSQSDSETIQSLSEAITELATKIPSVK